MSADLSPRSAPATSALLHTDVDLVLVADADGRCLDVTPSLTEILGIPVEELRGHLLSNVVQSADTPMISTMWEQLRRTGRLRSTVRLHRRSGSSVWLDISGQRFSSHPSYDGPVLLIVARDVSDDVVAQEHLAESEQRWRLAFEHSPIGAALVTAAGDIALANASMAEMLEHRPEDLAQLSISDLTHPDDRARDADKLAALLSGQAELYTVEKRFIAAGGRVLWGEMTAAAVHDMQGEVHEIVVQIKDVTQRREAELELANRALHDPLTGLANRFLVQQWLDGALQEHLGRDVGVLFCDLDRFKLVNDSLGHNAGDAVLVEASARLRSAVRPEDLVGRVGGDEFVVVCERLAGDDDLLRLATRLANALDEPMIVDGHLHTVTISIGAATGRSPDTAEEVLRRADMALLRAKRLGRARVEQFDAEIDRVATREDLQLEDELRQSVTSGELDAYYQPILTLADRQVVGHEALLRWNHPTRGQLQPEEFLDIAEISGLVRSLGWWMLDRACRDTAAALSGPGSDGRWVAVNASPGQLTRTDVYQTVVNTLHATGLAPERLHIEITETALIQAGQPLLDDLKGLRSLGVGIVLDDFGTGFSSLSLLRDLPVSMVKIDRSFIAPLLEDRGALAIVRAVLGMCRDLDLPVVAEGVESEAQAERLAEVGCSHVQGYLFGRPQSLRAAAPDGRTGDQ